MSEVMKDCGIKLFGKTIYLLPDRIFPSITVPEQSECSSSTSTSLDSKESTGSKLEYRDSSNIATEETMPTSSEISTDDPNTTTPEKNSSLSTKDDEPSDLSDDSEEKTLQKPDKIIPCPRCKSMETKFCYFNNYNVNQPRYFCKNCQRYWTSGGTMRNVPVGSGRRKNKSSLGPNYRHIMISDAQNGIHLPAFNQNGLIIFGEPAERSQNGGLNEFYEHPSGFPVAFYPVTPYWASSPGPTMVPTLGKHSRGGEMQLGKENKRSVLIPKTLRFDDPKEAAKSSIWSTIGIKNDNKNRSINGSGVFRAFEPLKLERHSSTVNKAEMVLHANPAALSRSVNFQESA